MSICPWNERTLTVMVEKVVETGGNFPGSCDVEWLVRVELRDSQRSRWRMSDGGRGKVSCPLSVFGFIPFCSLISVVLFIIRRYRVVQTFNMYTPVNLFVQFSSLLGPWGSYWTSLCFSITSFVGGYAKGCCRKFCAAA